jgi:hypothetical protein
MILVRMASWIMPVSMSEAERTASEMNKALLIMTFLLSR